MAAGRPSARRWTARLEEAACDGCRTCLPACDAGALIWVGFEDEVLIDRWACTGCGACVTACPRGAVRLERSTA